MRIKRYEIVADEGWTHTSPPLNRYWCFHAGVFGPESDGDRLEAALRASASASGLNGEVKWSSLSRFNIGAYKTLVDVFFHQIAGHNLTYRQIFLDRAFVYVPQAGEPPRTSLDTQYRICYQFLKHCFGLKFVPETDPKSLHHVTIRLDSHSSQKHTNELTQFAQNLAHTLGVVNLVTKVQFVNSKKLLRLQICDLLMGAAGSYGNKMHDRRNAGKRGMSPIQKCRLEMAKYIYAKLRELDAADRGSRAFNWFESTGTDGESENHLHHKIRIWKFIPAKHIIDKGWHNDHLDKQGRYQGPDLPQSAQSNKPADP